MTFISTPLDTLPIESLTNEQAWDRLWWTLREIDLPDLVDSEIEFRIDGRKARLAELRGEYKPSESVVTVEDFQAQEDLRRSIVETQSQIAGLQEESKELEYYFSELESKLRELEQASRARNLVEVKRLWRMFNDTACDLDEKAGYGFSDNPKYGTGEAWLLSADVEEKIEQLLAVLDTGSLSLLYRAGTDEGRLIEAPRLATALDVFLAERIAKDPQLMHSLSPREFEMLVADFFSSFGYQVEMTAQTRDGGRDLIAVRQENSIVSKLLIECKKYAPHRRVGVALVRELYAVKTMERATKAIMATTTMFSREARVIEARHRYELELKDFEAVSGWAKEYGKWMDGMRQS